MSKSWVNTITDLSPAHWWKFDGNTTDSGSQTAWSLTAVSTPVTTKPSPINDRCAYLPSNKGWTSTSANSATLFDDRTFTIEAWVRQEAISSTWAHIFRVDVTSGSGISGQEFSLRIRGEDSGATDKGKLHFYWLIPSGQSNAGTYQLTGTTVIADNKWHHVAVTVNGSDAKLYVDGAQQGSTLTTIPSTATGFDGTTARKSIGVLTGASSGINGYLDELVMHTTALSASQLETNYKSGRVKYQNQVLSLTPVVYFPFDESTGNASSVGSKIPEMTAYNSPTVNVSSNVSNKSISYDGTNDYHYYVTGSDSTNQFTGLSDGIFSIEMWVKANTIATSNNQVIWSMWDRNDSDRQLGLYLRGTGYSNTGKLTYYTLRNGINYQESISSSRIDDNKWNHIVITQNGSTTKIYINGTLETTKTDWTWTTFGWNDNSSVRTVLGAGVSNYITPTFTEYYNGGIDEFAVYGTELSSTNVTDNYNARIKENTYTSDVMVTSSPHATFPMPTVSIVTNVNISYTASPMLTASPHAEFVYPAFSTGSGAQINADSATASADIVTPTLSLDNVSDAFGVATASADSVTPTIQVQKQNNYSADPATASALFTEATVTTTRAVSVSAAPATASALLGGNVYAGPTVQDTTYEINIRQIGETTNTTGHSGFTIGSQWSNSSLDARNSLAIKPVTGVPSNGALIKVKFDSTHISTIQNDTSPTNYYNIYVFTANPSTTFNTMNYTNLPAKELLYTSRSNDADGYFTDLTTAFRDARAQQYGIFIEHVGTPPYFGTVWDRVQYSGSNLENKALYILTSEFTNVNFNAPAATASADMTAATVDTQKYVDYSHSVATASADIVNPVVSVQIYVSVEALVTTAIAEAIQPAFLATTNQQPGTLNAHSDIVNPQLAVTGSVFINVDASTVAAELHMPQAQIGENNSADHMNASALFVMPLLVINKSTVADAMIATALSPNATTNTGLIAIVNAQPMTARTFIVEPPAYFNYITDKWFKRLYDFQNNFAGYPNVPLLKFFTMTSDILPNAVPPGNTAFVDRIAFNATAPQGTFAFDRTYSFQTTSPAQKYIAWSTNGGGKLEVGYFDNQGRKAVRFNNTSFNWKSTFNLPTGSLSNPNDWSIEMMFKTSKQNQVLFSAGPLSTGGNSNRVYNLGLYNGKVFSTHAVGGPGNDAQLYRAFPWDTTYGVNYSGELVTHTVAGRKSIADDNWHHVVIQMISGRLQVFIDGELDYQRYNTTNLYPRSIGYGNWTADANCDFYISALAIAPDTYLSDRDIDVNYAAASGFSLYEAEPATATVAMPQNVQGRGNRPRALALYWWPQRRAASGAIDREEDLWDSQAGSKKSEFDYPTFFQNLDYYNTKSQKFFGWDIYTVHVTGEYVSEVVNPESYSGGIRTFNELIGRGPGQATVTKSGRGFRDPITDNRRYIDLINDIDLDQVEAIFFLNFPNESNERDAYSSNESVDEFFNIRESVIYQDFLASLRNAVDRGINLLVSNSQLALDLGIVDRVEIVDPLIDGVTWAPGGGYNADGEPRLPQIVGFPEDDYLRSADLVPGKTAISSPRDGRWHDYSFNNRLRIVNTIPGITDIMYFTLDDIAYFEINGQYRFGTPPEFYSRMVYRPNGATVGTEFIMPDKSDVGNAASNDFCRRYLAVPFENVKAGKIVAAFGQTYKRGNTTTPNPYANYATHIALERGTVLNGRPLGGRIWVTLTERPQFSTNSYNEVELGSDYWIDLTHSLGLITDAERTAYRNDPENINRRLERGEVTQAYFDKYMYWSELGFNQSTQVSGGARSAADQAVEALGTLFEKVFNKVIVRDESAFARFSYSSTGIIAMIQNFYLFPRAAVPTVSLNGAAFGWLANKEQIPGTQVRDIAGTANAVMIQPVVVGDKIASVNAQAAIGSATQVDPTNYVWTQKDVNVISLPMLATAIINPKLTLIRPETMTATITLPQNITTLAIDVDQVVLYINHTDPVLYLREDIVK